MHLCVCRSIENNVLAIILYSEAKKWSLLSTMCWTRAYILFHSSSLSVVSPPWDEGEANKTFPLVRHVRQKAWSCTRSSTPWDDGMNRVGQTEIDMSPSTHRTSNQVSTTEFERVSPYRDCKLVYRMKEHTTKFRIDICTYTYLLKQLSRHALSELVQCHAVKTLQVRIAHTLSL